MNNFKPEDFKGTPNEWTIRVMPDGSPFIEAPKIKETAGYNIEVFGGEDGNYPEEMRNADFMLGAAAKDLLFAGMEILHILSELDIPIHVLDAAINKMEVAIQKSLSPVPQPISYNNPLDDYDFLNNSQNPII